MLSAAKHLAVTRAGERAGGPGATAAQQPCVFALQKQPTPAAIAAGVAPERFAQGDTHNGPPENAGAPVKQAPAVSP
jgi:hypothetical protein